jgi:protein TonB
MEGLAGSSGGVMGSVFGSGTAPKVKAEAPKKVNISAGVAVGMLLQKTTPIYPPIAKAARVSGTVVLQATISKTGAIENLRVVSGPAMLQQAAMDAVKTWRYRPYLLNNDPVEVETTVNVIFTLGG